MVEALYRPLGMKAAMLVAGGIAAVTAIYCLSYNALSGQDEALGSALLWALINIIPWYAAFEAAKRASSKLWIAGALAAALAVSVLLHLLFHGIPEVIGFELLRRIPALLLVVVLLAGGQLLAANKAAPVASASGASLPLLPTDFDWVSAAGNYVELRTAGRTVLHRAPLSLVHAELERHGFVRIHRSILVRREKIARIRPGDVVLHDGTSLKTGKRYRAGLTLH